jgi:hypothetical protein
MEINAKSFQAGFSTMTAEAFVVPTKQIVSPSDLHAFIHSDSYTLLHTFIEDLSTSVEDTPITPDIKTSQVSGLETHTDRRMLILYLEF